VPVLIARVLKGLVPRENSTEKSQIFSVILKGSKNTDIEFEQSWLQMGLRFRSQKSPCVLAGVQGTASQRIRVGVDE